MSEIAPYSLLAEGYDEVMAHVDYVHWARYLRRLQRRHAPEARTVIELGCGTGRLAETFQPFGPPPHGFDYRAFDGSEAMLDVARRRVEAAEVPVRFARADFRDPLPGPPADLALLVYDGLNYLLQPEDVAALFARVAEALVPGGVFLFDLSTPANSLGNPDGFDDAGETEAFRYVRESRYDSEARLHTTTFRIETESGIHTEAHVQRAYALDEIHALLDASPLAFETAYHNFTDELATDETERVHWAARKPYAED